MTATSASFFSSPSRIPTASVAYPTTLGVPKAIREQTGKGPGDNLEVVVWKDEKARTVEVPAQFEDLMKKEGLLAVFKKLSYTHRKEYCRWITEAKKEETRLKRLEKAIEMLKKGVST
jgi:bifunctional DNA-binding transcriptional regulator/antitoxin component of YhaV-PrlF toxin-antitoxin module